ncbi:hypothetical protein C0Q70_17009 [Pomacea canaliculata]|uniref:HEAT repeat-containing protein 1 n=1 Tax=Pomacea canaliculata TaxID=400727 RepID=A0A2T7NRF0_POMCA|nr:hypothetical protein C0Q70_17009 [Pomacea canaliculata]
MNKPEFHTTSPKPNAIFITSEHEEEIKGKEDGKDNDAQKVQRMPETISTQPESEMHLDFYSAFEQQRINAWKKTTPSKVQKAGKQSTPPQPPSSPVTKSHTQSSYWKNESSVDYAHFVKNIQTYRPLPVTDAGLWLAGGKDVYWEDSRQPRSSHVPGWKIGMPKAMETRVKSAASQSSRYSKTGSIQAQLLKSKTDGDELPDLNDRSYPLQSYAGVRRMDFQRSTYDEDPLPGPVYDDVARSSTILQKNICYVDLQKIHPDLTREALYVVLLMFQTQEIKMISKRAFKYICQLPSFAMHLTSFSVRFKVSCLVSAVLPMLVPAAMKQTALDISSSSGCSSMDESETPNPEMMQILYDIIANVTMDIQCVTLAARLILENSLQFVSRDDKEEALGRMRKLIRIFEIRHSDNFHVAVDAVLASGLAKEEKRAVKEFLHLSVASVQHHLAPDSQATLALRLHHRKATVRMTAVKYVLDNLNTLEDHASVQESLLIRLQDDSQAVVTPILEYPELWTLFSGREEDLRSALLKRLAVADAGLSKSKLVLQLIKVLLENPDAKTSKTEALVISYSFLVSEQVDDAQLVLQILDSAATHGSHIISHLVQKWVPMLKNSIDSKVVPTQTSTALNKALVECLAEFMVSTDSPSSLVESLYEQTGFIPCQAALAGLLCEVCLHAVQKTKDEKITCGLQLQLASMIKDIILDRELIHRKLHKSESQEILEVMLHNLRRGCKLPAAWLVDLFSRWMKEIHMPLDLMDLLLELSSHSGRLASAFKELLSHFPKVFPSQEQFLRYLCMLWTDVGSPEPCAKLSAHRQARAIQLGINHVELLAGADAVSLLDKPAPASSLKVKGKQTDVADALLKVASSSETPSTVVNGVLQALSGLDSMETFEPLLPVLSHLMEKQAPNNTDLITIQHLTARFTPSLASCLKSDSPAMQLLTEAVKRDAVLIDGVRLQDLVIEKVNRDFFSALPDAASQHCVAKCLLDALLSTTSCSTAAQIRKVFKHVSLSVEFISQELSPVLKKTAASTLREVKRIRLEEKNRDTSFDSVEWQRVILLLEILQVKKKIPNGSKLVPICFNILSRCVLSGPVEGNDLNIEAVVRCIRSSDNPHTHQQALLVLAVAAKIVPEQLLHSMMSVFTFMGASILRQDDSYSFRVINRVIETVFPALFMACGDKPDRQATDMVTMALRLGWDGNDVLMLSCITSLHKVVDTLPHFLSPYLLDLLIQVCHLSSVIDVSAGGQKAQIAQRLKLISHSIATAIPARVLLPVITNCYTKLLEDKQESVKSLLIILDEHIQKMSREDINMAYQQLLAFFLSALDFRITQRKTLTSAVVDAVEGTVVTTLVSMVLKMSEVTFRPMLLKIFEWATLQEARKERILVFYRLADSLVDKLHSLFLLFAAHIIKHAAQLLDLTNSSKTDEPYFKKDKHRLKACQLLNHVLGCLQKCFLYDSENFINKERFDLLMQPLLDQIENKAGGDEAFHSRVKELIVPAVANFAAAVCDDSLWKTLNYQLMLKTRSSDKEVRLAALTVLEEFQRKLGEDYLPLLPETIPFLAELKEDDEDDVEKMCHKVIEEIEKTLGEPIQKYF